MSGTPISLIPASEGDANWLGERKPRMHRARQRAARAVNRERVRLDWQINRRLLPRPAEYNWGAKINARLARDLRTTFPERKGFFRVNPLDPLRFYFTAMDRQVKTQQDNPTIGLLLYKSKNTVEAKYALRDKTQPIGVAEYPLIQSLSEEWQRRLPPIEPIERELGGEHA